MNDDHSPASDDQEKPERLLSKPPSSMLRAVLRAATCGYLEPHAPIAATRVSKRALLTTHAARTDASVDLRNSNHHQHMRPEAVSGVMESTAVHDAIDKQRKRRRIEGDHRHHHLSWLQSCFRPRSTSPTAERIEPGSIHDSDEIKQQREQQEDEAHVCLEPAAEEVGVAEAGADAKLADHKQRRPKKPKHVRPTHFLAARVSHSPQVRAQ